MPVLIPFHIEDLRGTNLYLHFFHRLDQHFDLLDTQHTSTHTSFTLRHVEQQRHFLFWFC